MSVMNNSETEETRKTKSSQAKERYIFAQMAFYKHILVLLYI